MTEHTDKIQLVNKSNQIKENTELDKNLREIAKDIRCDVLTCIGHLGVGHIGGCLSVVELLTVLYFEAMHIDPKDPKMAGRDRFICSKGHAGPAVYATLANRGYFDKKELLTLNQGGTNLPSHCDMNRTVGIDMTTGSLGQGFSCAVGVALGSKLEGDGAIIYTLIGDGETQEGQIWEAAMFAAAKHLDNLIAFTDYNKLQIDGTVEEVNGIAPLDEKWRAFGWNVIDVEDGNDIDEVSAAVQHAKLGIGSGKPTMVILNTKKGCGVKWIEDLGAGNHNTNVTAEQAEAAIRELRGEA
ncbi:MAG: transketolase [Clostridia bacterium]|nr:transketolase [Clostridia bacterium]